MSTKLDAGFYDYIEGLSIAKTTKDNYRQYARWMEKYGSGELDIPTLQDEAKLADFIVLLGANFDADQRVVRQHRFNPYRKADAKTILRHYLHFLQATDKTIEEKQIQLDKAGEYSPDNSQDGKEKVLRSIALRRGQPKFRKELLAAYKWRCAITGTPIEDVLEAAHIIPYNGESTNHVCNGILLRSDIHALFDLGHITIDPQTLLVRCSEEIKGEEMYRDLDGKHLELPANANQRPSLDALRKHFGKRVR